MSLDVLRLTACFMVVLIHSPKPGIGTPGFVLSGLSYLTAPFIGLFFMVSGALLLPKQGSCIERFDTKMFLRKRFSKVLFPTIIWTLASLLLEGCGIKNSERDILWFMYTLLGVYLLTPVLSRWLCVAKRTEVEIYLCIWLLTVCMPFVKLFIPVNESDSSWLYYFHGYVGYYVLGWYLSRFAFDKLRWCVYGGLLLFFSFFLPLFVLWKHVEFNFYSLFWYLSISVVLICVLWWHLCHKVKPVPYLVTKLSNLSFGIYLIHILILRNILWKIDWISTLFGEGHPLSGLAQIVICTCLTFFLSAILCYLLSLTAIGKYLIGTR